MDGHQNLDISVKNTSVAKSIKISLGQTEPGVIALPSEKHVVSPGEILTIPKSFEGGCAKLFVWDDGANGMKDPKDPFLIWCGVVPLGGDTPILVDPDTKKVTYRGQDIPSCESVSGLVENFTPENEKSKKTGVGNLWYLVLALAILIALYLTYLSFVDGKPKMKK